MKAAHLPRHQLVIPLTIFWATDLNALDKMLLAEIIWCQDYATKKSIDKGYCYAKNAYFMACFNISWVQVSRTISKIAQLGYIKVKQDNGIREITYNFNKCFERDIMLGLRK